MKILTRALTALTVGVLAGAALLGIEVAVARSGVRPEAGPANPSDAPAGPPGTAVDAVVWLGDSTASGVGVTTAGASLPEQVAGLIGKPVRLTVLATSGARVADVLHDQLPRVSGLHPTVVFISVGANDTTHLTARGSFRRDYGRLLAGLPGGIRSVVLLGVPDMGSPPRMAQPLRAVAGWRGRELDADVRHLAGPDPPRHLRRHRGQDRAVVPPAPGPVLRSGPLPPEPGRLRVVGHSGGRSGRRRVSASPRSAGSSEVLPREGHPLDGPTTTESG